MNAPTLTWLALMTATMGSFSIAEYLPQRRLAVAAILLVAAFKVQLILRQFMELKSGPLSWRTTFAVWTAACTAMIVGLTWYTMTK